VCERLRGAGVGAGQPRRRLGEAVFERLHAEGKAFGDADLERFAFTKEDTA
jgi:hypothetical protein